MKKLYPFNGKVTDFHIFLYILLSLLYKISLFLFLRNPNSSYSAQDVIEILFHQEQLPP